MIKERMLIETGLPSWLSDLHPVSGQKTGQQLKLVFVDIGDEDSIIESQAPNLYPDHDNKILNTAQQILDTYRQDFEDLAKR